MPYANTLIKARTPRYRTIPLFQTPRRGEKRPTPVILPVDDERRDDWFPTIGNSETSWISLGDSEAEKPQDTTRHGWPFVPVPAGDTLRHRPGTLDYALNAQNLDSQIVPSSAGRGAVDPKRAGYDLMARIYSAKRWRVSGTIQGQSINETWGPFTTLSLNIINGATDATEILVEGPNDGRDMVPLGFSVSILNSPPLGNDGTSLSARISLIAPSASPNFDGWDGRFSYIGAGIDDVGNSIIQPSITGIVDVRESQITGNSSELTTFVIGGFSPRKVFSGVSNEFYDVEVSPITLCGYNLTYQIPPDHLGEITGSLAVEVAEFWGPDEWPA